MSSPRLFDALPELVREGLISAEQAERIRARYATVPDQSGRRLLVLFSILGGLLIGLGIILVVAHNWDSLSRTIRTALAFLPLLIGQLLVAFVLLKRPEERGWKEGTSVFLLLAVGACLALVSQTYHIPGELEGFLLTWSLLVVALLYVPGSLVAALLYIGLITWYALLARSGWSGREELPWLFLPLFAVVVPLYVQEWRARGVTVGFYWLSLFVALAIGIMSQLFWYGTHVEIALGILGLAVAYLLLPLLHGDRDLRTGAFPLLGSAGVLGVLIFLSYHDAWMELHREQRIDGPDLWTVVLLFAVGAAAYARSLRVRKPFTGSWFPESLGVVLVVYAISHGSPALATLLINVWMLALGIGQVRSGMEHGALGRMNLGLAIIGLVIVLRFFDLDINDALKGVVFIAMGVGSLMLNMRLLRQRKQQGHA